MLRGDADLVARAKWRAGTYVVTASFLRHQLEPEGIQQPRLPPFGFSVNESATSPDGAAGPAIDSFSIEGVQIRVLHTPGHAQDSLCYEIEHPHGPPAIAVGDTVYARSAGKIPRNYRHSLNLLRHKLLSGNPDTLLLPGHGPVTTVGTERKSNPFFAD